MSENRETESRYAAYRDWLFKIDPERAHGLAAVAARAGHRFAGGYLRRMFGFEDASLEQWVWRMRFVNPIGLAAGFDKNARLLGFAEDAGFGFTEVGSVSALPSRGNPRPRAFRLPADEALINRMGLNNSGARRIAARIRRRRDGTHIPLGINIAKTNDPKIMGEAAIDDFVETFRRVGPLADYVTLNISCPNTAEGKTFEEPEAFEPLLRAIMEARLDLRSQVAVLVKFSPPPTARVVYDSTIEEIIALSLEHGVEGFVATNTASDRQGLKTDSQRLEEIGRGGLSGPPIEDRANQLVRYLYARTEGAVPIIGVGGVRSGESAYRKFLAGATLVQLYTALIYEGPAVVQRIKQELVECLQRDGHRNLRSVVGLDVRNEPERFSRSVSGP